MDVTPESPGIGLFDGASMSPRFIMHEMQIKPCPKKRIAFTTTWLLKWWITVVQNRVWKGLKSLKMRGDWCRNARTTTSIEYVVFVIQRLASIEWVPSTPIINGMVRLSPSFSPTSQRRPYSAFPLKEERFLISISKKRHDTGAVFAGAGGCPPSTLWRLLCAQGQWAFLFMFFA